MWENAISGCSMARAWYKSNAAPFEAAYKALVGAGITAATEDIKAIEGDGEDRMSKGICRFVNVCQKNKTGKRPGRTHKSHGRCQRPNKITSTCSIGNFYALFDSIRTRILKFFNRIWPLYSGSSKQRADCRNASNHGKRVETSPGFQIGYFNMCIENTGDN